MKARSGEALIRELTSVARSQQDDLSRFAWRCLSLRAYRPQKEDIEDALSEAYLVAATRIRREENLEIVNLPGWFRRVLFFVCLKKVDRKRSLGLTVQIADLEFEDNALRADPDWEKSLLIRDLLDNLDAKDRQILNLAAQGESSRSIAGKLGSSPDNVRQMKSRAVRSLRNLMMSKK